MRQEETKRKNKSGGGILGALLGTEKKGAVDPAQPRTKSEEYYDEVIALLQRERAKFEAAARKAGVM